MVSLRWLVLGIPLLAGCAAGARVGLRPESTPLRPASPPAPAVAALVDAINANAAPLSGLTASTTVSVNQARFGGGASGQLALERPRNFRLTLERGLGTPVVDVGSNQTEFWVWTKDSKEKAIYVGQYGAGGTVPPDLIFQPDWIVEALGLRPIPPDEAAQIKLTRGKEPGTWVLTHVRSDGHGGRSIKRTIYDETTRKIRQHIFYGPDGQTPVAVVTPSYPKAFPVERLDPSGSASETIELPQKIHLELMASDDPNDRLIMDLALRDVRINPSFTETNRAALFRVPAYNGYEVVSLTPQGGATSARSRQSRGVPPTEDRSSAIDPIPLGLEGNRLLSSDPRPIEPDLAAGSPRISAAESIVRPTFPRGPGAEPPAGNPDDVLRAGLVR
ncbi:MAG: hypothetical protein KatS3mg108_1633 [Isosphaeraceae bacterium]|jgi:hypothetical protein|nr:MAG: hypothetical protein KatS3mg108_1633 [Isosphaeraceae bacterium]